MMNQRLSWIEQRIEQHLWTEGFAKLVATLIAAAAQGGRFARYE
jgi:hypothetical protein